MLAKFSTYLVMELTEALFTLIADSLSASTKTLSDRAFVHA